MDLELDSIVDAFSVQVVPELSFVRRFGRESPSVEDVDEDELDDDDETDDRREGEYVSEALVSGDGLEGESAGLLTEGLNPSSRNSEASTSNVGASSSTWVSGKEGPSTFELICCAQHVIGCCSRLIQSATYLRFWRCKCAR